MINLIKLRQTKSSDILKLSEVVQRTKFLNNITSNALSRPSHHTVEALTRSSMTQDNLKSVISCGLLTFLLHCEARIASSLGVGFYTIGPCGEELLSAASLHMKSTDSSALHYRHVANSILRQSLAGRSVEDIALDRARGFVCSVNDPITGGKHCSIGGSRFDFLVTSTLASQAPPAVGRALGISLSNKLIGKDALMPLDSLSYISVGDGSINNGHFLSALNMAKYAANRKMKCPVLFAVSDNGKCISLRGHGYVDEFVSKSGIEHFVADGINIVDVFEKSKSAMEYSRSLSKPAMILFKNLPRRFGHAATDRQHAYMKPEEIMSEADKNPLEYACSLAVEAGIFTPTSLEELFVSYQDVVERAFDEAVNEPKITSRDALIASNSRPLATATTTTATTTAITTATTDAVTHKFTVRYPFRSEKIINEANRPEAMRKHMTRVYEEILASQPDTVYIGEDVEHGGYYLVTEGLASKFPFRVRDFPPDETSIIGAGMGFSQLGLVPIVEMPYSKYLDCAADMFNEAIIMNWLSNGQQSNGMLLRLQGFDKGVFGGNFHTHNMLSIPPGLDVVVFSNGFDYVRGIRYAMRQARAGRVVMSVDSTDLLNRRHLFEKDDICLTEYPSLQEEMSFDDIVIYARHGDKVHPMEASKKKSNTRVKLAILSYGNGVPTSLAAMDKLCKEYGYSDDEIIVIDSPYISAPPGELLKLLDKKMSNIKIEHFIFADVCKDGPGMPLANMATKIQNLGLLNIPWRAIGASNTYNPLSRTLTFLAVDDIILAAQQFHKN